MGGPISSKNRINAVIVNSSGFKARPDAVLWSNSKIENMEIGVKAKPVRNPLYNEIPLK